MEKPKVLFLCPQPLWPTNTGARLRNYHLAHALCQWCEVTILQAADPSAAPSSAADPCFHAVLSAPRQKGYTPGKVMRGLVGPVPLTVLNYVSNDIKRLLAKTLGSKRFDILQIESIHMTTYVKALSDPPKIVLDWHNIESELMQRYAADSRNPAKRLVAFRTSHLLYQLEQHALHSFAAHSAVSQVERAKLCRRAPNARIHVIANGVDTAAFHHKEPRPRRNTLLFVGSMDYHANSEGVLWFCRDIWPQLAREFPDLKFKIAGRNPPAAIQALGSARIIVTGTVDDVKPYYEEAFAVIVPLRAGGGTRLKILEAMAARVPVISTRLGAEGISVEDGQNILLADTADDTSRAIRDLINEPEIVTRLQQNAHSLVAENYDWKVLARQLLSVYESLL